MPKNLSALSGLNGVDECLMGISFEAGNEFDTSCPEEFTNSANEVLVGKITTQNAALFKDFLKENNE